MSYQKIEKSAWPSFCDHISKQLEGKPVEIDVIGLDVGDQIAASGLSLSGFTYDSADDAINVYLQVGSPEESPDRGHIEHAIQSPRELYAEMGDRGISQVVVMDADGNKQFVTLQEQLALPSGAAGITS